MLISRKIADIERDHFQGILDGFYAIALTFLSLDLPGQIHRLLDKRLIHPYYTNGIILIFILLVASHIFMFIILFEMLCIHKAILKIYPLSLGGVRLTLLVMALVSLIPVMADVGNESRYALFFIPELPERTSLMQGLLATRACLWLLMLFIYLSLFLLNKLSIDLASNAKDFESKIFPGREISKVLYLRIAASAFYLYCIFTNQPLAYLHPLSGTTLLVSLTLLEKPVSSLLGKLFRRLTRNI